MHRLWLVSLSLCCCLLAVAIWTSSKSQRPPLADASEVLEAARYLKALRENWEDRTAETQAEFAKADQFLDAPRGLELSGTPVKAITPTLAQPLPNRLSSGQENRTTPSYQSGTQDQAEFVASEMTPYLAAVERTSAETRVSIMHRPKPITASSSQSTAVNSAEPWELTAQELQVASTHLSYGKTLARKGATASARNEFLNALAVIAQSRDLRLGGKDHVNALNQAVLALAEAEDLFGKPGSSNLDADVATVSAGHLSRILDPAVAKQLTRADALNAYQEFARRNLQAACGRNWLASETFYALGRLHNLLSLADPAQQPCELSKSLTFHQAALSADANNFASANELGVLLARQGQLEEAKRLLIHSVTLSPRRETWTNLATVHQRLGETRLAQLAAGEAKSLVERTSQANASPLIRLVAPAEFETIPNDQDSGPVERNVQNTNEARNPPLR
jgi:tetratricopeptide (TPR) repeat protein